MRRATSRRAAAGGLTVITVTVATVSAGAALARAGIAAAPGSPSVALTTLTVTLALWSEYAPRPRRTLDRLRAAAVRIGLAIGVLAFAGWLGVGFVPAPAVLAVVGVVTAVIVPVFQTILRSVVRPQRVVLVGDDAGKLGDAVAELEASPIGHVSPPRLSLASAAPDSLDVERLRTDGGLSPTDEGEAGTTEADASGDVEGDGGTTSERSTESHEAGREASEGGGTGAGDGSASADVESLADGSRTTATDDIGETDGDGSRDPPPVSAMETAAGPSATGPATERISGLTRLQNLLVSRDVDAVVLGFSASDRQEFFGALRVCRERGVDAKVHAVHAPATLIDDAPAARSGKEDDRKSTGEHADQTRSDPQILDANVEPLPLHRRVAKRGFDVCFATVGLVALAPLVLVIAVAIRLDSPGPVLYGQSRTARLGRVFTLWKFRTMADGAERDTGPTLSDEDVGDVDARVTRVGQVLRATHLDEIPQLLSVLAGDMTVVGPRPERPALESEITADGIEWERRWFVKPGLTGLAQIHEITGFQPAEKLAHDLEYVERQSLALDVRIVIEQLRLVVVDALALLAPGEDE